MMYKGLENTNIDMPPDPILPINDPNMKLCINVLCAGRPNYLYISLDSIFRSTVFQTDKKPDIFVYIDHLSNGMNFIKDCMEAISNFPVRNVYINEKHKGTVANYWYSFSKAFNDGYDYCILIEEDWLITTDALQWFYDCPKIAAHYSLYRWEDRIGIDTKNEYTILRNGESLSWCVGFSKDSWNFFYNVIKANGYYEPHRVFRYGNQEVPLPIMRRMNYIDWDSILIPIMQLYKLTSIIPPRSMLAHFGCKTSNFMGYGSGVNRHEQMFGSEKERWLDNVIQVFNETTDEEKTLLHLYPLTFKYR